VFLDFYVSALCNLGFVMRLIQRAGLGPLVFSIGFEVQSSGQFLFRE